MSGFFCLCYGLTGVVRILKSWCIPYAVILTIQAYLKNIEMIDNRISFHHNLIHKTIDEGIHRQFHTFPYTVQPFAIAAEWRFR